jgi:predicted HTH transcriptional regulator
LLKIYPYCFIKNGVWGYSPSCFLRVVIGKKLILLNVLAGEETPYYYASDGVMEAYVRLGNESVKADSIEMKRLVLRGKNSSFDSLSTND